MGITDSLFKVIVNGRKGRNIGIKTTMPKIDRITYGIQRGYIYTIFADSGAGKTT